MRYCRLDNDIKQMCETSIGGISKVYLINYEDFVEVDGDNIIMGDGKIAYEIDVMRNTASFVQTAINNNEYTYVNNILTFTLNFHSSNLEDELHNLTLGKYKLLIKYNNNYWRFVDEDENTYFRQISLINNSGVDGTDINGVTITMQLNGHNYGILYEKMPNIIISEKTKPIWVLIEQDCEEE